MTSPRLTARDRGRRPPGPASPPARATAARHHRDPSERHHLGGDERGAPSPAAPSDAFPTPAVDLPTRAADGTVYPGETWEQARPRALGFDAQRMEAIARDARPSRTHVPARRPQGQGRRRVELARGRRRDAARGLLGDQVDHQHPGRAWRRPTATSTSTTGPSATSRSGAARSPGRSRIRDILSNVSGRFWDLGTDYGDLPQAQDRTQFADRPEPAVPARARCGPTTTRPSRPSTGSSRRRPASRPATYAAERLFGPIGMTHTQMTADPAGNTNAFFGTQTTCEDLARFGYLFLRHGRWGDDQVVPRAWVEAAVGPSVAGPQRGVRPALVAQPQGPDHRPARDRRARPARSRPSARPCRGCRPTPSRPRASAARWCSSTRRPRPSSSGSASSRPAPSDALHRPDAARFVTEALVRP